MDRLSLWTTGWRLGLLTIFILILSSLYFQKRRQDEADELFGRQHGCQPIKRKLPYRWPLAIDVFKGQYDALMRGALLAYQADFFRNFEVGQTFQVRLLGRVGYFTMDPKNLEHMLQTQFDKWALGNSRDALLPMIGHGIFTQDGPAWKHSRELLRRQFVRMHYQEISSFEGPVNDLLAHLQPCTGVVDLQPAFFSFTLATTVALIFGEPFEGLEQSEHAAFAEAFDYTSLISAMRMRLADWYWVYNPSKYRKACALINTYATHYVNHALKELEVNGEDVATKRHPFILDLFRELQHPKLVRDQLMNVLIAGRDTTACLMSWAW
ncbi:n-alkane-inducible cytochrome P450 [Purpureocillium lavendulum]|uniref:N-alkane-inducible cytochrome P450 n=1 Tax=Purpureocillium lavendulum TaxID=1247861 RepID=A0AB34FAM4_9HYPO|nr:n-alkane-inducible cytochrome P450 [Purpureocillium lavendulum]